MNQNTKRLFNHDPELVAEVIIISILMSTYKSLQRSDHGQFLHLPNKSYPFDQQLHAIIQFNGQL